MSLAVVDTKRRMLSARQGSPTPFVVTVTKHAVDVSKATAGLYVEI